MRAKFFYVGIFLLCTLGLFARFYLLTRIPLGYYFDEMDYIFTGEALARLGTDITGNWSPFLLRPLQLINNISELGALFHAIVQKLFGFGPRTGHLTSALFGLFSAGILATIAHVITKKKEISLAVLATILVSPWHIFISRVSYEGVISLFFQLLFILGSILVLTQKKAASLKYKIGAIVLMLSGAFFAYFTYHGAKFTIFALSLVTLLLILFSKRITTHSKITFGLPVFFLLVLLFAHSHYIQRQGGFGDRNTETIFNQTALADQVNRYRKKSLDFPGKSIVISKPTVFFENVIKRYTNVFDVYQWGITGEEDLFQFSLFVHGFVYISTVPLTFLGLYYLYRRKPYHTQVTLLYIVVAPITNVVSNANSQSVFRSALVYALLLFFTGVGVYAVWKKNKKLFYILLVWMCLEVLFFASTYFGRYPIVTADNHYFYQSQVAAYIAHSENPVTILTSNPSESYTLARSIIYYNQLMPILSHEEKKQFETIKGEYAFASISLTTVCPKTLPTNTILLASAEKTEKCSLFETEVADTTQENDTTNVTPQPNTVHHGLASPIDSRIYYYIFNDTVCADIPLEKYTYQTNSENFDMIQITTETFCKSWVIQE